MNETMTVEEKTFDDLRAFFSNLEENVKTLPPERAHLYLREQEQILFCVYSVRLKT